MQILTKWNADFSDVWRSPPLSHLKVSIKRRQTRGWGPVYLFLKHGQMLHCVPASIKSSQTEILDRGNEHEGERSTGGIMGRETTCAKASVAKSCYFSRTCIFVAACVYVWSGIASVTVINKKDQINGILRKTTPPFCSVFQLLSPPMCSWFHTFFPQQMVTIFLFLYRRYTGIGVSTCYCM